MAQKPVKNRVNIEAVTAKLELGTPDRTEAVIVNAISPVKNDFIHFMNWMGAPAEALEPIKEVTLECVFPTQDESGLDDRLPIERIVRTTDEDIGAEWVVRARPALSLVEQLHRAVLVTYTDTYGLIDGSDSKVCAGITVELIAKMALAKYFIGQMEESIGDDRRLFSPRDRRFGIVSYMSGVALNSLSIRQDTAYESLNRIMAENLPEWIRTVTDVCYLSNYPNRRTDYLDMLAVGMTRPMTGTEIYRTHQSYSRLSKRTKPHLSLVQ